MSRHGRERPITPSASSATPRTRWSPRSGGKANTASTSSRWRTAARASRRCWRKTRLTDRDLEAVAKSGMPIIPTATFLAVVVELGQTVTAEQVQLDINRMKRHFDLLCELMHKARKLGIKLLVGTDTGNNSFTRYGELHAKELEIFVKHGGYTPMEAIVAATRDNAYAVGLEGRQFGRPLRPTPPASRSQTLRGADR